MGTMEARYISLLAMLVSNLRYSSNAWTSVPPRSVEEISDDVRDWANFSGIADPVVANVTRHFHTYCPFTSLCTVETYYDVHPVMFRYMADMREVECCNPCDCSPSCYETHTCCPDIVGRLVTHEEISDLLTVPEACVAMTYRPVADNDKDTQFCTVFTKCPESYDNVDVKLKCETDYHNAESAYELIDIIPVTDIVTNVTFMNSKCAECHTSDRANYVYWDVKVVCELNAGQLAPLFQHPDDILSVIKDVDYCDLQFQIPYGIDSNIVHSCDRYIDRCNVTGYWTTYDPLLHRACHSYASPYKGYRNVHCFLCNGHTEPDIDLVCLIPGMGGFTPSSFAALLDFNNIEKSKTDSNTGSSKECSTGEAYDYEEKICRELTCPVYTILRNGSCTPLFATYETPTAFDVELRLFPDRPDKLQPELWSLRERLIGDVRNWTDSVSSALVAVCNIDMFLKFEAPTSEIEHIWPGQQKVDAMIIANIEYIYVRIRISGEFIRNTTEFIVEVYNWLEDMRQLYGNWTIAYADIDDIYFDSSNYIYADFDPLPPGVDGKLEWMLMVFGFDDPFDGQSVNPYPPLVPYSYMEWSLYCREAVKLSPKQICPKIELSIQDPDSGHGFVKVITDLGFNISNVILSNSGNISILRVCHSDYIGFQQPGTGGPHATESTSGYSADVIVSIVCSLASIVCLSVTFLVYCTLPSIRTVPGINNMGLVFHLFCAQTLYLVGGTVDIANKRLCKIIGVFLHFMLLSSFFWMFVCTFHMLRVFVSIGRQASHHSGRYINVKYVLLAEIPAVIVIAVTVLVSLLRSDMESIGYGGQPCYLSDADMIYFTVAIPLGCVIVANMCMFIFVVVTISRLPSIQKNTTHERSNILIFIKLSTITGLTWVFAFIYQWTDVMVLAYLFIIVNGCQGVFIMASFVINKRVLNLITSKRARYTTSARRTMRTSITGPGKRPGISVIDNGMTRVPSERPANNLDQTADKDVSKISVNE